MTVYARAVRVLYNPGDDTYTEGKEYEALPPRDEFDGDFDIITDNGTLIWCQWTNDPDVDWERVER